MRHVGPIGSLLCALALVASTAHAGPEDIPPPGQTTSTPELKPEPEPTAKPEEQGAPAPPKAGDERFHVEAAFLMSPVYDVVIDYDDEYVHAGSRNGHGLAFGGEGAISYRISGGFHLGLGARVQTSSRGGPVRGSILHVPARLAYVMPVLNDAWLSYGIGAGFSRAWITPTSLLPDGNASNGFTAEARFAFMKRLFAKVDGVVSVTGWIGPLTSNAFGSSGLTIGLGFRFGA